MNSTELSVVQKQEVQVVSPQAGALFSDANVLHQHALALVIDDDASESLALDVAKRIKQSVNALDKDRRSLVDPLNDVVKSINARYKPYTDALTKGETIIKQKLKVRIDEKRRIAEEEARKRQAELEAKALEEAAQREVEGDVLGAEAQIDRAVRTTVMPSPPQRVEGGLTGASASVVKRWKPRVVDVAALAQAYPNTIEIKESAIMALYRAGITNVPGVEFYQEESIAVR